MKQQPRPSLDLERVNNATFCARERAEGSLRKALNYHRDTEREARLGARQCPWCWYFRRHRVAGQAFTDWTCAGCGAEKSHANTATPRLCAACAEKYGLCCECAADMELRTRRKLEKK